MLILSVSYHLIALFKQLPFSFFFFFNDTATTEIYTLSLHDALPIYTPQLRISTFCLRSLKPTCHYRCFSDRKSTRLNSSHTVISYAVFCLKKKNKQRHRCSSTELLFAPPYWVGTSILSVSFALQLIV